MGRASDFTRLYRKWFHVAYGAALDVLRSPTDAEDVAQSLFTRLWHTGAWRTIAHPRQFFRESGRREAVSLLRHWHALPWTVPLDAVSLTRLKSVLPLPDDRLERAERRALAVGLIKRLPPRCQAVCALVFLGGFTHQDAAHALGITPKAVEKQVARAHRLLRQLAAWTDKSEVSPFVDRGG